MWGGKWGGIKEALEVTIAGEVEDRDDTEVDEGLLSGVLRFSLEAKGWLTLGEAKRGCFVDGGVDSLSELLLDRGLLGDSLKGLD